MSQAALPMTAVSVALLAFLFQAGSPAEQPQAAGQLVPAAENRADAARAETSEPQRIAVIDVAHVFKNSTKFDRLRAELKGRIEAADQEAQQKGSQIKELQEQLKQGGFEVGSDDYIALESEIAKETAQFEAWRKTNQQRFLRDEASIYKTIYLEVSEAVHAHAIDQDLTLVIRFNRSNPEELEQLTDPDKILKSLSGMAIYWKPEADITDAILAKLNRRDQMARLSPP